MILSLSISGQDGSICVLSNKVPLVSKIER